MTSQIWPEYVAAYNEFIRCRMQLHREHLDDLAEAIRASLFSPGWECAAAIEAIPHVPREVSLKLIPSLIRVALSVHGQTANARRALGILPREQVINELSSMEPRVLEERNDQGYACLIELWIALGGDQEARSLAATAAGDPDDEIREVGETYLERLKAKP